MNHLVGEKRGASKGVGQALGHQAKEVLLALAVMGSHGSMCSRPEGDGPGW